MNRRQVAALPAIVKALTPTAGTWGRSFKKAPDGTPPHVAQMTEAQLSGFIKTFCHRIGLPAYHTHNSERSEGGFPDWTIAGPDHVWFLELKGWQPGAKRYGQPSLEQTDWLTALGRAASVTARLVYPWQWAEIEADILSKCRA